MESYQAKILATAKCLPEKVLTNSDIAKMVDTSDEWIFERTGIKERRISSPEGGEHPTDLAATAGKEALKKANLKPNDIDLILLASISPDMHVPGASCLLQQKLEITNKCACLDINAACSGFAYAMTMANSLIQTGVMKNILIVGTEMLSTITNWEDRGSCILFGDGCGVAILGRADIGDSSQIYSARLAAEGDGAELLNMPLGGSLNPMTKTNVMDSGRYLTMKGRDIFKMATRTMARLGKEAIGLAGLNKDDIDWVIPHQANIRIIDTTVKLLGVNPEKVIVNIQKYGNTSAATIPIAFDEAIEDGRIKRGDNILLVAFGAGLTSGAVLLKY